MSRKVLRKQWETKENHRKLKKQSKKQKHKEKQMKTNKQGNFINRGGLLTAGNGYQGICSRQNSLRHLFFVCFFDGPCSCQRETIKNKEKTSKNKDNCIFCYLCVLHAFYFLFRAPPKRDLLFRLQRHFSSLLAAF